MPGSLITRIFEPQPIWRLAMIRICVPLAILGFLASRLVHADDWLSTAGFHPPELVGDWRQPVALPPVPPGVAWAIAIALVIAGLATSAGLFTRWSSAAFAALLAYTTLADRLEAFTVSKLGTVLAVAIALTPCGARYSFDSRRSPDKPELCSGGNILFFQVMLPVFYFSSGWCKATGDWLSNPYVLWSHLHDSYQTPVSYFAANHMPAFGWTVMQATTLAFELGAPLLFAWRVTRPYALIYGVAMHTLIGLMFGPVIWFALLMIILLHASYGPRVNVNPIVRWFRG
ncbi:MAG: HTTM domain-containing protein [Kofleriaceae bacterium]